MPHEIVTRKSGPHNWTIQLLQDDRTITVMDHVPTAAIARHAAARFAAAHGGRSVEQVASDRAVQLLLHAIRAEFDPDYVNVLRGYVADARYQTREEQLAAERDQVRRDLRDPAAHPLWSVHAHWRASSEALALGRRAAHIDSLREQLEYVERHLAALPAPAGAPPPVHPGSAVSFAAP